GGKRPLSSMTPTIVTRDGKLFMVTGSPGGPRIITTTLATIQNAIDFGMGAQAAVAAPRFHHQWLPDLVYVEPRAFTAATAQRLREMGYAIDDRFEEWGSAQTIVVDPRSGRLFGGSDPRSPAGAALGF
ncbi:MAG: gamma-glutamyltransferase, partial [Candidatus Eremiobacteraeota bacterium]|nr:gamma-glutamyltransferase [Candidatus Eremiobacteraeota bacterium]